MRHPLTEARLREFMKRLGQAATGKSDVFLVGGASAVLHGWRETTLDVDLTIMPERDEVYRAIPQIKEDLEINVEIASPFDFIPEIEGWRERSPFITSEGSLSFFHFDFYGQALAKIERGHDRDLRDVESMVLDGLVEPALLAKHFEAIEDRLYRYPAIDPPSFRRSVHQFLGRL